MIAELVVVQNAFIALYSCPRQDEIELIVNAGLSAYHELISRFEVAFARHQMRCENLETLDRLSPFFGEELFNTCLTNIQDNKSNLDELEPIINSFSSLSAY